MAKYRKKSIVIDAVQWFKNGDHPKDGAEVFKEGEFKGEKLEGKIVRYYRTPDIDGQEECKECGDIMHNHGWIDIIEDGSVVCPGDFIIKSGEREFYPCKPHIFKQLYEDI